MPVEGLLLPRLPLQQAVYVVDAGFDAPCEPAQLVFVLVVGPAGDVVANGFLAGPVEGSPCHVDDCLRYGGREDRGVLVGSRVADPCERRPGVMEHGRPRRRGRQGAVGPPESDGDRLVVAIEVDG